MFAPKFETSSDIVTNKWLNLTKKGKGAKYYILHSGTLPPPPQSPGREGGGGGGEGKKVRSLRGNSCRTGGKSSNVSFFNLHYSFSHYDHELQAPCPPKKPRERERERQRDRETERGGLPIQWKKF